VLELRAIQVSRCLWVSFRTRRASPHAASGGLPSSADGRPGSCGVVRCRVAGQSPGRGFVPEQGSPGVHGASSPRWRLNRLLTASPACAGVVIWVFSSSWFHFTKVV
jgi:hypothetical protein